MTGRMAGDALRLIKPTLMKLAAMQGDANRNGFRADFVGQCLNDLREIPAQNLRRAVYPLILKEMNQIAQDAFIRTA